jgi:multiple sugar transport system substrate-binding protein
MKKGLSFIFLMVFALLLIACDNKTTTVTTGTTGTTGTTNAPVTLTYAAWNLGTVDSVNLERLMLDAFEAEYPWITVEIVERPKVPDPSGTTEIDQNWNEFLGARAAQGTLPDVYFTDSTETTIMNNWTMDVTDIAEADPEFMNISADIRNASKYGGKLMALPYAVYYFGYFVNKTIFENANADAPLFEDTFAEFLEKIGDVANHNVTNGTGIAGLVGVDRMLEWYPAQLNPDLGWYTYDGSILHLNGTEFEQTLALYTSLMQNANLVYDAMTPEAQLAAFGTTNAWASSQLAAYWEYTPIIGTMLEYDFDIDFIGTPCTAAAHQIPLVLDLMCISSQTDHLEEAYELAKWMSFGKEGYLKRIELSNTVEGVSALNMTPLQIDEDMLDAFFGIYSSFVEFRKVVEYGDYIIEPNKYVPGYIKARWNASYDAEKSVGQLFDMVRNGEVNYADVKGSWNTIANNALTVARQAVFEKLGVTE